MNRARARSAPLDVPPDLAPHRLVADLLSMRLGGWEARRTAVVHVVQRERGVTCGWVASGGAQFEDKIAAVREATDSARPSPTVAEAVARIRSEADAAVANARSCGGEDAGCELSGVAALAPRFHSVFSDWNALLQQALAAAPDEVALATGEPASPEAPCEASAAAASFDPRAVKAYAAFAHLKEATGIERAFLCGALALPEEALPHLPSRAFADLVIGLQQQRAFEERVRQAASPKLLELIRAGFELKPELQRLQERLRCDFDIAALRATLSADRCWQIMTDHLDKLEQLQLLVYTEMSRVAAAGERHGAAQEAVRRTIEALSSGGGRGGGGGGGAAEAAESLSRLAAEEIKEELIRRLGAATAGSRSPSPAAAAAGRAAATARLDEPLPAGFAQIRISIDRLLFQRRVGAGASGTTYLARYQGADVCVKVAGGAANDLEAWKTEVRALDKLRHANIVRCLGVLLEPPTHGLVLEYIEGTDLTRALASPTPRGFALCVGEGIADGMLYLHTRGVMHRDLKGANVMVGGDGLRTVKIIDFGLAARAPDDTKAGGWLTAETGTYRWMAPEVVLHERYSKAADVYSFAMVWYELLCHQLPFADRPPLQAAVSTALNGQRPPLPQGTPAPIAQLMTSCWQRDPASRPSFGEALQRVRGLRDEGGLSAADAAWLDAPEGHPVYYVTRRKAASATTGTPAAAEGASGMSRTEAEMDALAASGTVS